MKPIPALVATALAVALVLSPMVAFAAGSISFSSPVSGASYSGSQSYTISGTVSPTPTQADNVVISVTNPTGQVVDADLATVSLTTGAFSYSTAVGGSTYWTSGTYTISASDDFGATGTTTFSYTSSSTSTVSGLVFEAQASSLVLPGDTAMVSALVVSSGTPVSGANFSGSWLWTPGSTSPTPLGSATAGPAGTYEWSIPISSTAPSGLYAVYLSLTYSGSRTWTMADFTVSSSVASNSALGSLSSQLGSLSSMVNATQAAVSSLAGSVSNILAVAGATSTSVGIISTGVTNMQSQINSISTTLGTVSTNVGSIATAVGQIQGSLSSLSTAVGNAQSAANSAASSAAAAQSAANDAKTAINNTSTYVLAVVVIVAITLVLELAILVRKSS